KFRLGRCGVPGGGGGGGIEAVAAGGRGCAHVWFSDADSVVPTGILRSVAAPCAARASACNERPPPGHRAEHGFRVRPSSSAEVSAIPVRNGRVRVGGQKRPDMAADGRTRGGAGRYRTEHTVGACVRTGGAEEGSRRLVL